MSVVLINHSTNGPAAGDIGGQKFCYEQGVPCDPSETELEVIKGAGFKAIPAEIYAAYHEV